MAFAPPSSPKPHYIIFLNVSFLFLFIFFLSTDFHSFSSPSPNFTTHQLTRGNHGCENFDKLRDYKTKCSYLKSHSNPCGPHGYIDYLHLFYCYFGTHPLLGSSLLVLWLLVLFYLLGNTASQYFCFSLESLSKLLNLPPTIAGVTLLSLGNGAPDVFATIVSFSGPEVGDVGLSSVLGGAFFVSSVVVGVISISVGSLSISIDRFSFVRDVGFLIIVLCFILAMLVIGKIGIFGAICFVFLYFVYVFTVSMSYCWKKRNGELGMPLLDDVKVEEPMYVREEARECEKANWLNWLIYLVELPLYLPRRLTIPDVSEERWSKPFAVASVVLSPMLLATLWNTKGGEFGSEERLTVYLLGVLFALILGVIAIETTERSRPPKKFLFPWLAGGFLMSVVWTYMTAGELVSLLVSFGHILGISPSVLGVTVLAWGNSVGDLIANVAMALNGGVDGAQIAISGCYAGPIFNTLVGLGLSLVLSSWTSHPSPFVIPKDSSLFVTLGFLIGGLLWALIMLPRRGMKLDRVLGIGLLAIYLCFLCLRICESTGLVQLGELFQ